MKATQTLSRRRAIQIGAVMFPALAASPAAAVCRLDGPEADPIHAAIEAYQRAYAYSGECLNKADAIESKIWLRSIATADEKAPECIPLSAAYDAVKDDPVWMSDDETLKEEFRLVRDRYLDSRHNKIRCQALRELDDTPESAETERLREEGSHVQTEAGWAVADTVPTTVAGALALIHFVEDCELGGHCILDWTRDIAVDDTGTEIFENYAEAVMQSIAEFLQSLA